MNKPKTIYTSYYANVKNLPPEMVPVAISVGIPKYYEGKTNKNLAPTWAMMKKPRADYDRLFLAHLETLDPQYVYDSLPDNAVLLCYEKPNDWCHRRAVAEWLEKHLNIIVREYGLARFESYPYAECKKEYAGKKRPDPSKTRADEEPLSVRLRRESMKKPLNRTGWSLFDFDGGR